MSNHSPHYETEDMKPGRDYTTFAREAADKRKRVVAKHVDAGVAVTSEDATD